MTNLSFSKIATVPSTGLTVGRIYFETSTGLIKVATSTAAYDAFGGVRDAQWNSASQHLVITNANGSTIDLDLSDVASATEVSTAIAGKADKTYVDEELGNKVDKVTGKGLSTNDYTTAEKTKLSGIAANAQVNVIESVKVNGTALEVTDKAVNVVVPAATVTGVKSGDKVLALANKELSTTLGLTYDSATKKINLTGIDSAVIASVDATDFIKDGMVEGVSFDPATKKLTITFNTDSGAEDIEVDLTSLVDTYTQGTGITITGNVISVDTSTIATVASVSAVDAKLGAGFASNNTVATQLAAVKATAEAATTVSEVNSQIDAKIAELDYLDEGTGFVKVVTQTDGVIAVEKAAIAVGDVPVLPIAKVDGLQDALDSATSAGVTSFGAKTGAITIRGGQAATAPAVNLAMSGNQLQATVVGVATSAQGTKADTALQTISAGSSSPYLTLTVTGEEGSGSQRVSASLGIQSVETSTDNAKGVAEAYDVKTYVDNTIASAMSWTEFA